MNDVSYVPGVCNINQAEIRRRRSAGHIGLAVFIIVLVALVITDPNRWIRLVLFGPAFVSAIGYLQAKNRFCVGFAGSGLQHVGNKAEKVDPEDSETDRRRSQQLNRQAILYALAATGLALLIP